jgi:hypothetical protein
MMPPFLCCTVRARPGARADQTGGAGIVAPGPRAHNPEKRRFVASRPCDRVRALCVNIGSLGRATSGVQRGTHGCTASCRQHAGTHPQASCQDVLRMTMILKHHVRQSCLANRCKDFGSQATPIGLNDRYPVTGPTPKPCWRQPSPPSKRRPRAEQQRGRPAPHHLSE